MVDYSGGRGEIISSQCLLAILKVVQWYFKSQAEPILNFTLFKAVLLVEGPGNA